ncbi:hypothetical protein UU7_03392 [Rhodanobacter spathiphylli B39]|uniref:Uncharacterized protein n=1 Tax=Rhodanobacter spathiphylli B39 TaxID=1163407 RepID=I4W6T2_9GAMM|nr:hypothetical protein UU7_03392 [Rhodanobacter spathiphylli B39]
MSFRPFGDPNRRDAQRITLCETGIGLGTLAVDAHLTRTQKPIDHALGDALEQGHQRVVDTLTIPFGTDLDLTYTVRCVMGSCRLH